jgi:hypothetical protein
MRRCLKPLILLASIFFLLRPRGRKQNKASGKNIQTNDPQKQGGRHEEDSHPESVACAANTRNRRDESEHNQQETAVARRLDWVAVFTLLLVIVGAFQVWVYMVTERAYLSLSAIGMDSPPTADKPIVLRLQVKNSGRTTAFVVDANVTVFAVAPNEQLPEKPRYTAGGRVSAIFGPIVAGDTFFGTVRPQTRDHHPFTWTAPWLAAGTRMYVFGFVKYDDGFGLLRLGTTRITGFCARYDPVEYPAMGTFATCEEQNYRYGN